MVKLMALTELVSDRVCTTDDEFFLGDASFEESL
jgi:hypothetical protein